MQRLFYLHCLPGALLGMQNQGPPLASYLWRRSRVAIISVFSSHGERDYRFWKLKNKCGFTGIQTVEKHEMYPPQTLYKPCSHEQLWTQSYSLLQLCWAIFPLQRTAGQQKLRMREFVPWVPFQEDTTWTIPVWMNKLPQIHTYVYTNIIFRCTYMPIDWYYCRKRHQLGFTLCGC